MGRRVAPGREEGSLISLELATFLGIDTTEFALDAAREAYARGLSPPTAEQRDRIERQAAVYLIKHGNPEQIEVVQAWLDARKDVRSGRAKNAAGGTTGRGRDREATG